MAQACTQPDKCRTHKPILHVPQSAIVLFTTPEKPNGLSVSLLFTGKILSWCEEILCLTVLIGFFCHQILKNRTENLPDTYMMFQYVAKNIE
jgi:hypothetical protein